MNDCVGADLQKKKKQALIQVLVSAVLFSTGGLLIKSVPWPPLAISGSRGIIASVMMFLFIKARGWRFRFEKQAFIQAGFMGATLTLFVAANKMTTAANAIVLQYISPVFILLISVIFLHQKPKKADLLVVAAAFCGMGLFFFDQLSADGMIGNLMAIASGLALAAMYVMVGEMEEEVRFTGMMMGHFLTFLIGLPTIVTADLECSPLAIGCILALGIGQIWLPYVLLAMAVTYCTPLTCNLVGIIEPLLNPVWVFLVTGEAPGVYALLGGAVIIFSVSAWCVWNDRQEAKTKNNEAAG